MRRISVTVSGSSPSLWRSPNARDQAGGDTIDPDSIKRRIARGHQINLSDQVHLTRAPVTMWTTASARDGKDTPGMARVAADGRKRDDQLPRQVALYQTPTALGFDDSHRPGGNRNLDSIRAHATAATHPSGPIASGRSGQTEKRAALNPEFVFWLMGFKPAWLNSAPQETLSSRKSRPSSLPQAGKRSRSAPMPSKPIVEQHEGVHVVRDDLCPGGTKARYIPALFEGVTELVYASPAEGGAQFALASVAKALGKKATIFVAKRAEPHPRAFQAKALGAQILQVEPGYLTVVQKRASDYCKATGATLAPFGMDVPGATEAIAAAAKLTGLEPDEVWCAAGSGTLARGLAAAFPKAARHVVQVGRALTRDEVAGAVIHVYPKPFGYALTSGCPFPADPHYDAKAWAFCKARANLKRGRVVLFWCVTGPAT